MRTPTLLVALCALYSAHASGAACDDVNAVGPQAVDSTLLLETRVVIANPGSNITQQTFVRVVNPNDATTSVEIYGIDDGGVGSRNSPISFTLGPQASKQFNAQDMENGNAAKGLSSSLCNGQGKWQLRVRSDNPIKVMGLIRTPDGFLTSVNDVVPSSGDENLVYFANPASNLTQQTFLRIVNLTNTTGTVTITGIDDRGVSSSGSQSFVLGANESKQINAQDLEGGNANKGLTGSLGNGTGKWRLSVTSSLDLDVMSLIRTPDGFLTNLSGMVDAAEFGDRVIYFANPASDTARQTFLRIINTSDQSGTVAIAGIDDAGQPAPSGNVLFDLGPNESKQMNIQDLEQGNVGKGIVGFLGDGQGRWRLTVSAAIDLQVMSLVRTPDGFLTNLSRVTPVSDGVNDVFFFNPASNTNQVSSLRIVNDSGQQGSVVISGIDDNGNAAPGGDVTFNIPANAGMSVTAQDLENGDAGSGLVGALGNGSGKWRLQVTSDVDLKVQGLMDTASGFLTNISRPVGIRTSDASAYFNVNISDSIIQSTCIACHVQGGVASASILKYIPAGESDYQNSNFQLLRSYIEQDRTRANTILEKVRGVGHGGGAQLSSDSQDYENLVAFLELLGGEIDDSNRNQLGDFWNGVTLTGAEQTLRRAALIVAGRLPTDAESIAVRIGDDATLRQVIRGMMEGDNFHDFLVSGANDRLLTDAFFGNLFFDVADPQRFPTVANTMFFDRPQDEAGQIAKDHRNMQWRWGMMRAPLELIAYIVMNDRPYTEVVTADYMMLNFKTSEYLNSNVAFATEDHRIYKPGRNQGQILVDEQLVSEDDLEFGFNIISHSGFIDYPHAGVLNTHAFLNRYPTTETNRNRARARWTYFHFLGVDIEKSAQRTVDPVALADTNNPTMNNPACTVCHSIHDPVAGTFQNYGNTGLYREAWGGLDALPETYKFPQAFDPDADPGPYQQGDTWFRDMREPGFDGQVTYAADDSLVWLGARIAEDPRFATAAVKFWWPALMGAEVLSAPEVSTDVDFIERLSAFEAQNDFVETLGAQFAVGFNGGMSFDAKALLTEMIMSPWFRATQSDDSLSAASSVPGYGTNRLLTPRELELKSRALLGWTWGENENQGSYDGTMSNLMDQFRLYYGGIDANGIKERSRAVTSLMANVAEIQAFSMACPAVVIDFSRADADRLLFKGIDAASTPATSAGALAIQSKLIDLHQKLLGETLAIGDEELEASYQLLVETWQARNAQSGPGSDWAWTWPDERCDFYLDEHWAPGGIANDVVDPSRMLNTWTSILIYLMTDFRYLHE